MMSRPPGPNALAQSFLSDLSENETRLAAATFSRLANLPGWIEHGFFQSLARSAETHPKAFLDALLAAEETTFTRLSFIAKALELGWKLGRFDAVRSRTEALRASGEHRSVRFNSGDALPRIAPTPAVLAEVSRIKYPEGVGDFATFLGFSEQAWTRIDLPARVLGTLYDHADDKTVSREDWERRVRTAFCVDQMSVDYITLSARSWKQGRVLDRLSIASPHETLGPSLRQLKSSKGLLFVFMHGGFPVHVASTFRLLDADGVRVGTSPVSQANILATAQNPKAALFLMMRSIEDGRSILLAADGADGKRNTSLRVIDREFRMAEGAPFIAYETGCETVWLYVQRKEGQFVPGFALGPRRSGPESYKAFKERWLAFYAERIEAVLSGDPDDLALRAPWERFLMRPQKPGDEAR
jgi:hypothetical protein